MTVEVPAGRRLAVEADLRIELDGRPATLTGSGSELVLRLTDPAHAFAATRGSLLPADLRLSPRALGRLAEVLHDAGLQLSVRGPRAELLVLGRTGGGPVRLVTGSPYVRLGRVRSVLPVAARIVAVTVRQRAGFRKRARPSYSGPGRP